MAVDALASTAQSFDLKSQGDAEGLQVVAKSEGLSLIFVGHMVDLPNHSTPRFPAYLEHIARIEIARRIARHTEGWREGNVKAFASLARGGDILFHEVCRNFGFDTVIVLPFSPDRFLRTSVEGAEVGDWPRRFYKLWQETPPARRYDLGLLDSDDAYAICNERILALAQSEGDVQLIALWDGCASADGPWGIVDFIEHVKQSSDREPDVIDPKDLIQAVSVSGLYRPR